MRSPKRLPLVLAFATTTIIATACGDDGGSSAAVNSTGGAGGGGGSAPAPNEYRFETSSYEVKAGEEINYYCFTTTIPDDSDMVVIEEDLDESPAARPEVVAVRPGDYRSLFARLRRGDRARQPQA